MRKERRKKRQSTAPRVSELAEDTARYEREMVIDEFDPMTAAARARWARAKRKPGRPRRGKGAKVISVSVERGLLTRSDALAKDLGLSRAGLIERGLKAVLSAEGREIFLSDEEMAKIRSDRNLQRRLKSGHRDVASRRGRFA